MGKDLLPMPSGVTMTRLAGFVQLSFFDQTWGAPVFVLLGANTAQWACWMQKTFRLKEPPTSCSSYAHTTAVTHDGIYYVVLCLCEKPDWSLAWLSALVHESHHAADMILRRKGMLSTPETQEAFAYLTDSIFYRTTKAVKDANYFERRPKKARKVRKASMGATPKQKKPRRKK